MDGSGGGHQSPLSSTPPPSSVHDGIMSAPFISSAPPSFDSNSVLSNSLDATLFTMIPAPHATIMPYDTARRPQAVYIPGGHYMSDRYMMLDCTVLGANSVTIWQLPSFPAMAPSGGKMIATVSSYSDTNNEAII